MNGLNSKIGKTTIHPEVEKGIQKIENTPDCEVYARTLRAQVKKVLAHGGAGFHVSKNVEKALDILNIE